MKYIILLISILYTSIGITQDSFYANLYSGVSTYFIANSQLIINPQNLYFNDLYWDKNKNFAISAGITYQTDSVSFLNEKYYLTTELNLSYRGYLDKQFLDLWILSNNLYFPQKVKNKKLRLLAGVRNSLVMLNLAPKENNDRINRKTYILGGTMLLNYKMTKKMNIGLNIYIDFSKVGGSPGGSKYKTAEAMIRLAYQIR